MNKTVMIVDDALFMRSILRNILQEQGLSVIAEAASGIEAMKLLHENNPDIILLDIFLPDANGLELLETIFKTCPQAKVIICSSTTQEAVIQKALDQGAKAFLQKPFTPETIAEALASLEC